MANFTKKNATENQIKEIGAIVKIINRAGGTLTVSVINNTIRATGPTKDILKLKTELDKLIN